ncbi:hypothetical protein AB4039_21450 [Streptomyces sp. M-16]|uniref:hypothetical protein n=1 Tax=Streptomyces sp. M-16 TaxID=3233040 RepID=UPI002257D73D
MSTPPPNPYSGAPVPPNPYAQGAGAPNPYDRPQPGAPNPYGQPQPGGPVPAQQPPYAQPYPQQPQQPHPQYAHPQHPPYLVPGPTGCRNCGAPEAVNFAVRAHVGVLVVMRFHRLDGPFCRRCGRALVRIMTTKTLFQGWWSPLSLVLFTPFTLFWNLIASTKFAKLEPSEPAPGRQQLDEGPPVHARPLAYVAIVPLLWAVWVITHIIADVSG